MLAPYNECHPLWSELFSMPLLSVGRSPHPTETCSGGESVQDITSLLSKAHPQRCPPQAKALGWMGHPWKSWVSCGFGRSLLPRGLMPSCLLLPFGRKLMKGFNIQATWVAIGVALRGAASAQHHNRSVLTCWPGSQEVPGVSNAGADPTSPELDTEKPRHLIQTQPPLPPFPRHGLQFSLELLAVG